MRLIKTIMLWSIGFLVCVAVLANAVSSWYQQDNPELSLKFNHFNSDARINQLSDTLNEETTARSLLEASAIEGLQYAPSDARFLSILAVLREQAGDEMGAKQLYLATLKREPTEIQAVYRMFNYAVEENDLAGAARYVELIGRRWRDLWYLVEPSLEALLSNTEAYDILAHGLGKTRSGRSMLINTLNQSDNLDAATRLLLEWHGKGSEGLSQLVSTIVKALIDQDNPGAAYSLFQKTLPQQKRNFTSNVFNDDFRFDFSRSPFDWRLVSQAGLSVRRVPNAMSDETDNSQDSGFNLEFRFRNSPVALRNMFQNLVLDPGEYALSIRYETRRLKAPKPIFLNVACTEDRSSIARLELSPAETGQKAVSVSFRVPTENCASQTLWLSNDLKVKSRKNRFDGTLILSRVAIQPKTS